LAVNQIALLLGFGQNRVSMVTAESNRLKTHYYHRLNHH